MYVSIRVGIQIVPYRWVETDRGRNGIPPDIAAMKMKMADGNSAVLRRNRPGTKADVSSRWFYFTQS